MRITAITIIGMLLLTTASWAADFKLGIVDFQQILKESRAGKAAQTEIARKAKGMESDFEAKKNEIEAMRNQLEKDALVMSRDRREEKEREIRIKINDAKTLQKKYMEDFKEAEAQVIRRIQKDFFDLVGEIGKREGYTLIIEKLGVLYSQDAVDITDKLIREYDARYRGN